MLRVLRYAWPWAAAAALTVTVAEGLPLIGYLPVKLYWFLCTKIILNLAGDHLSVTQTPLLELVLLVSCNLCRRLNITITITKKHAQRSHQHRTSMPPTRISVSWERETMSGWLFRGGCPALHGHSCLHHRRGQYQCIVACHNHWAYTPWGNSPGTNERDSHSGNGKHRRGLPLALQQRRPILGKSCVRRRRQKVPLPYQSHAIIIT